MQRCPKVTVVKGRTALQQVANVPRHKTPTVTNQDTNQDTDQNTNQDTGQDTDQDT